MDFSEYSEKAGTTAAYKGSGTYRGLVYCAFGLLGESGEIAGKLSKCNRDNDEVITPEMRVKILSEIGDTLWFMDRLCKELDSTLAEVALDNLAKLADRKARGVIQGSGDNR